MRGRSWRLPTGSGSSLTGKGPRARVIRPEVVTLDQPDELGGLGLEERPAIEWRTVVLKGRDRTGAA